jgi:hypothetical protein
MSKPIEDAFLNKLARMISAAAPGVAFSIIVYNLTDAGLESGYVSNIDPGTASDVLADVAKEPKKQDKANRKKYD